MDPATCTFCGGAAALMPTEECRLCLACAKRTAKLASSGESLDVWNVPAPTASDHEMKEAAARVAAQLSSDDADSHYYLAVAYRQMGLHADALRSAALAVHAAPNEGKATAALRVLVTAPLMTNDGLDRLRERVFRMGLD